MALNETTSVQLSYPFCDCTSGQANAVPNRFGRQVAIRLQFRKNSSVEFVESHRRGFQRASPKYPVPWQPETTGVQTVLASLTGSVAGTG